MDKHCKNIPVLQYLKEPVKKLNDLYTRYPLGGEYGWFAFVQDRGAFAYWNTDKRRWTIVSGAPLSQIDITDVAGLSDELARYIPFTGNTDENPVTGVLVFNDPDTNNKGYVSMNGHDLTVSSAVNINLQTSESGKAYYNGNEIATVNQIRKSAGTGLRFPATGNDTLELTTDTGSMFIQAANELRLACGSDGGDLSLASLANINITTYGDSIINTAGSSAITINDANGIDIHSDGLVNLESNNEMRMISRYGSTSGSVVISRSGMSLYSDLDVTLGNRNNSIYISNGGTNITSNGGVAITDGSNNRIDVGGSDGSVNIASGNNNIELGGRNNDMNFSAYNGMNFSTYFPINMYGHNGIKLSTPTLSISLGDGVSMTGNNVDIQSGSRTAVKLDGSNNSVRMYSGNSHIDLYDGSINASAGGTSYVDMNDLTMEIAAPQITIFSASLALPEIQTGSIPDIAYLLALNSNDEIIKVAQ